MDKVLIVEDNPVLLKILETGLKKYEKKFLSITARDGQEAIEILKTTPISLLVTDLQMPKVDGLSLLAYMNDHHPDIQCIVMSAHGTPQLKEKISLDVLRFIEKPFEIEELVQTILPTLERDDPAGHLNGISIANFLQMIHMERKTCLLEIETQDAQKGYIYFENGVLFDAVYGEETGEAAALEIIPHERAKIRFKNLARGKKKVNRRIQKELTAITMDAMRRKDEADAAAAAAEAAISMEEEALGDSLDDIDEDFELLDLDDEIDVAKELDNGPELIMEPTSDTAPVSTADDDLDLTEGLDDSFDLDVELEGKTDVIRDTKGPGEAPPPPGADEAEELILEVEAPDEPEIATDPEDVAEEPVFDFHETAEPDSPPPPAKKATIDILRRLLKDLFTIGGYRASAILDAGGEVLASDMSGEELDLEYTAAMFSNIFQGTRKICEKTGFQDSREMTIVSSKGIVIMLGSSMEGMMTFVIMLILEPDGNQALGRLSIKRMLPRIAEVIG